MLCFLASFFLSGFLLFQVQPLISKYILPWFGGTPALWSASLLFFQTLLLGGNAFAHGLVGRLSTRKQGIVSLVLLAISLGLLLVTGNEEFLQLPDIAGRSAAPAEAPGLRIWTDDYTDLYHVLVRE